MERPIVFSGEMVRRILAEDETQKTQTRRIMSPQPSLHHYIQPMWGTSPPPNPVEFGERWLWREVGPDYPDDESDDRRCPFGIPGDRLWVRETWRTMERDCDAVDGILFRADDTFVRITPTIESAYRWIEAHNNDKHGTKWRPAIFLPRWASRITLEITDVRNQLLRDISEDDARAEGVDPFFTRFPRVGREQRLTSGDLACDAEYRASFAVLWDEINGKRRERYYPELGERGYGSACTRLRKDASWKANPRVWAVTFRRLNLPQPIFPKETES